MRSERQSLSAHRAAEPSLLSTGLSGDHFEICDEFMFIRRTCAHHDLELSWFHCESHFAVVEAQLFRRQSEFDCSLLSRFQGDALKAFQFLDGPCHAGRHIPYVELHDFVTGTPAGVLDINTDVQSSVGTNPLCT